MGDLDSRHSEAASLLFSPRFSTLNGPFFIPEELDGVPQHPPDAPVVEAPDAAAEWRPDDDWDEPPSFQISV